MLTIDSYCAYVNVHLIISQWPSKEWTFDESPDHIHAAGFRYTVRKGRILASYAKASQLDACAEDAFMRHHILQNVCATLYAWHAGIHGLAL